LPYVLGCGEDQTIADDDQRDDLLAFGELDAANAGGVATHRTHFFFIEANGLATA